MKADRTWRLRQLSPITADGLVVRAAESETRVNASDPRVAGWRVRWDTPTRNNRSKTFTRERAGSASAAKQQAEDLAAAVKAAALGGWHEAPDGKPRRGAPDTPRRASEVTFAQLVEGFLGSKSGTAPKTREYYETHAAFAVHHLPANLLTRDVTTDHCQQLLEVRRQTPGNKARKAVRLGANPYDGAVARCSKRTEKAFIQVLKAVFEYGLRRTPPALTSNPASTLKVRSSDVPDPSATVTFSKEEVFMLADAVGEDHRALVLVRGTSGLRSGEAVALVADDVDIDNLTLVLRGSEGKVSSRHGDGAGRSYKAPLKHRQEGEDRDVPLLPDGRVLDALKSLLESAPERHRRREALLRRRVQRWEREGRPDLRHRAERELAEHLSRSVRVFTMRNGALLEPDKFDRDVFQPALARVFPDVPDDEDATSRHRQLRELRFYDLRAAAISSWVADHGVDHDVAAKWAGHSLKTQLKYYRKTRSADDAEGRARLRQDPGDA